jgi:hypothetical protein
MLTVPVFYDHGLPQRWRKARLLNGVQGRFWIHAQVLRLSGSCRRLCQNSPLIRYCLRVQRHFRTDIDLLLSAPRVWNIYLNLALSFDGGQVSSCLSLLVAIVLGWQDVMRIDGNVLAHSPRIVYFLLLHGHIDVLVDCVLRR